MVKIIDEVVELTFGKPDANGRYRYDEQYAESENLHILFRNHNPTLKYYDVARDVSNE